METTHEKIRLESPDPDYGDSWICLCDNTPDRSGFLPCDVYGRQVEPTLEGPWGGKLYVCLECGRIIDQDTLVVEGKADLTQKCVYCGELVAGPYTACLTEGCNGSEARALPCEICGGLPCLEGCRP